MPTTSATSLADARREAQAVCDHPPVSRWVEGCSGPGCRSKRARYARARKKAARDGTPYLVPAEPVRDHLRSLHEAGMTYVAIAERTGVPYETISSIVHSGTVATQAVTAETLLDVRPDWESGGRHSAVGTSRRLRALARAGWSLADISRATGVSVSTLIRPRDHPDVQVYARIAAPVRDFYEAHSHLAGPSPRAAEEAAALGWDPAFVWDDETIGNPHAVPNYGQARDPLVDPIKVEARLRGYPTERLNRAEWDLAIRWGATRWRYTDGEIAALLDDPASDKTTTDRSIVRRRNQLGIAPARRATWEQAS